MASVTKPIRRVRRLIGFALVMEWNKKQLPASLIALNLIPETPKQERVFFRAWTLVRTVQIPKERVAPFLRLGIVFRAPDGPQRRVISLNAFVVWQEWLKKGQNLKPRTAIGVLARRK